MTCDVSVIILTFNEEKNISFAVESVRGWAKSVFVFDSFSVDKTVELARELGCHVVQHQFENYGSQRNAALALLPIETEWVFFLDADEWITAALKQEIALRIAQHPRANGFFVKWRLIWMGKWIRRGYYPSWLVRLFRKDSARCETRGVNEHLIVDGELGFLQGEFIHEDHNDLGRWIDKHNRYATREAEELARGPSEGAIAASVFGTQAERKRWIRERIWNRLPPIGRPFLYFGWRYFLRGGFLEGREALAFHLMQGLWFPMLIDLKYLEMRRRGYAQGPARSQGAHVAPRRRSDHEPPALHVDDDGT